MCPLTGFGGDQLAISWVDVTTDSVKFRGEVGTIRREKENAFHELQDSCNVTSFSK